MEQQLLDRVLASLLAIMSGIASILWTLNSRLRKETRENEDGLVSNNFLLEKINRLELKLAEKYLNKEDIHDIFSRLENKIDHINNVLTRSKT